MNYDDFVRWFPDQQESKTVSRQGNTSVLQGVVDLPWPLTNRSFRIRDTNVTETVGGETHYHNGWTYVPGSGNIVDTTGFFYVSPSRVTQTGASFASSSRPTSASRSPTSS